MQNLTDYGNLENGEIPKMPDLGSIENGMLNMSDFGNLTFEMPNITNQKEMDEFSSMWNNIHVLNFIPNYFFIITALCTFLQF